MNSSYYATLPSSPPPLGVKSNFDHPVTRAREIHVAFGICLGLVTIMVPLRCYVKLAITKMWGWDDWTCLVSFLGLWAYGIVIFSLEKWVGLHQWDIRAISYTRFNAAVELYAVAALFMKLSLFILYLRLFQIDTVTRNLIYGGMICCGIFYTISIILNAAESVPSQPNNLEAWIVKNRQFQYPLEVFTIAQSSFGTLSDIYLLVLPIRVVWQLHLPIGRKLGVSAVFLCGLLAIGLSIAGLVSRIILDHESDQTWTSVNTFIFGMAEISVGIACSSTPILVALFKRENLRLPTSRYYSSILNVSSRTDTRHNARSASTQNIRPIKCKDAQENRGILDIELEDGLS